MNDFDKEKAYEEAKKRLSEERAFYTHLVAYVVMNLVIAFFKIKVGQYVDSAEYNNWLFWNIIATPLFWGIGLLGHGLWTFNRRKIEKKWFSKSVYGEEWEKRKIEEIMKKDDF